MFRRNTGYYIVLAAVAVVLAAASLVTLALYLTGGESTEPALDLPMPTPAATVVAFGPNPPTPQPTYMYVVIMPAAVPSALAANIQAGEFVVLRVIIDPSAQDLPVLMRPDSKAYSWTISNPSATYERDKDTESRIAFAYSQFCRMQCRMREVTVRTKGMMPIWGAPTLAGYTALP